MLKKVCDSPFALPGKTCADVKAQTNCAKMPALNEYQSKMVAAGCSKKQANSQWNNFQSCLCGGPSSGKKGLSVPVIIIISVAGAVVLGVVIYLLARKKK